VQQCTGCHICFCIVARVNCEAARLCTWVGGERERRRWGGGVTSEQHVAADTLPLGLAQLSGLCHLHVSQLPNWRRRPHSPNLHSDQKWAPPYLNGHCLIVSHATPLRHLWCMAQTLSSKKYHLTQGTVKHCGPENTDFTDQSSNESACCQPSCHNKTISFSRTKRLNSKILSLNYELGVQATHPDDACSSVDIFNRTVADQSC
jgi:hypothetical protein